VEAQYIRADKDGRYKLLSLTCDFCKRYRQFSSKAGR
jgi:hypothetical protein